ncbi:unnamed protein product [Orchesella dallaii]|uniref:Ankyrin repeat protein n=1 Tax=Orchesella dallaii TaxID=48710 RepID=A0ABP1RB86_9HEXA
MFRKLMEMRFERIQRDDGNGSTSIFQKFWKLYIQNTNPVKVFTNAHMFAALQLLFPSYAEKFQTTLVGNRQIESGKLCFIGILEKKDTDEETPRFVHRTFAEYFLGLLVAKMLTKQSEFDSWFPSRKAVINSFIQKVLQTTHSLGDLLSSCKVGKFEGIESASFQNPVICYFINAHLKQIGAHVNKGCQWTNDALEVYYGLAACSFHDYPALCSRIVEPKAHKELLSKYDVKLQDLILLSAKYSGLDLFKPLYNFLMENLTKESFQTSSSPAFRITPLHVAVERGNFVIAEFLLNVPKDKSLEDAKYLIHCCVGGSIADSPASISQKNQIISLLLRKNKECINEPLPDGSPPLLSSRVHIKLLQHLLKSGVDVNVTNNGESILHKITENEISPQNYHDLLLLLVNSGFSEFHTSDSKKRILLHAAVETIELMEKTLKLFLSHGVNFNAVDGLGDSVLFYTLRSGRSVNFTRTLIAFGADLTLKNFENENVFNVCARFGNHHALEFFLSCNEINITGVVEGDITGSTPFIKGLTFGKGLTVHIIQLMEEKGLEINKEVASKGLLNLLCNTNLTTLHLVFDAEFVAVADYLIRKGGVLACKNKERPWELDETRKTMDSIIQAINCNSLLLKELEKRGIKIETLTDHNSDALYKELQASYPQSFEKLCVSLIACNQTKPFVLLKWCLQTDSQNTKAPHERLVGFLI